MRTLHNIDLKNNESGFTLRWQDRLILSHSADAPCLWIGAGEADIEMFRGNFSIKDKLNEKIALTNATVTQQHGLGNPLYPRRRGERDTAGGRRC